MKRRIALAPQEGWLTLGLVLLMCLTLAWSIDGARYLGREEYLDFLVLAAAGGVLAGFIGPKVGWGRWLTYLIGAIFAALIVPLLTATINSPQGASLYDLYHATASAAMAAYIDLAILRKEVTIQFLHHAMVFGLLVWATSMFASYAVFGHRRALNAVVVVGVLLVGNMAANYVDQLVLLVLFSVAALFLLIRAHVFDEQSEWMRRRIGDPGSISTVYLRGGTGFIAVTVAAAVLLTQTASSDPLAGAWGGIGDGLISFTQSISKFLPSGGSVRSGGVSFSSTSVVSGVWSQDSGIAVTIRRSTVEDTDYYWRAVTYDKADLTAWSIGTPATTLSKPARALVLEGLDDYADEQGLHAFAFTVIPDRYNQSLMLSPETPVSVGENVRLTYVGERGYFTKMERDGGSDEYQITALVPVLGNEPGQLNASDLRQTSTDYPAEILARFAATPPDGSLGPKALALEQKIVDDAPSDAPVDLAQQLVKELHSGDYDYDPDVRDLPCPGLSTVECFATHKRGYCQYFARTMAIILRNQGIPTRVVDGFLPGTREAGIERIPNSSAHEWVEVYFMGYGWVMFDPTPAGVPGQAGPLPSGPPKASGSPRASANAPLPTLNLPRDDGGLGARPGAGGPITPGSFGPLVAMTVLLLLVMGGLAFVVWQRGPRGATTADAAYGMVTRIASRFGFGPRPAQTVYEYAGTLGDVLPEVRPELETVARAKVESVYAREVLGADRVETLRAAQRRLRVALLRLVLRRQERRRRRH